MTDNGKFDIKLLDGKALEEFIGTLGVKELNELNDNQVEYVAGLMPERLNKRIAVLVKEVMPLEKTRDAILSSMLSVTPIYISPEITILPGLKVRYQTLLDYQQEDIFEESARARSSTLAQVNQATTMSKLFVAHSIHTINESPLANVVVGKALVDMLSADPAKGVETMVGLRTKRMRELATKPPLVIQALYAGYVQFQSIVDAAVHFESSGDPEKDAARITDIVGAVGKSQGPERAGLAPT